MTASDHRLPADAAHGFGGQAIDRSQPLHMTLDGRTIPAFAGDTVLSAVLAAGIDTCGRRGREPVALDERLAPAVALRRQRTDPHGAMPMDRVPALPGLDLVTLGPQRQRADRGGWRGRLDWLLGPPRSLGHRLDDSTASRTRWLQAPERTRLETDLLVVGGGLSGMSAALAAAARGQTVILVETRPHLGGDARFFGTVGEEEPPDAVIARLSAEIAASDRITLLLRTEGLSLTGTELQAHQVETTADSVHGRLLAIAARRVVLATGTDERLPVFAGNRLPGVVGAVAAFHRAERYGLWSGRHALVTTSHNFAYRLALLADAAGITVQRIVDSRPDPQSRFIDFAKASGIVLATGLVPQMVAPAARGRGLAVDFTVAVADIERDAPTLASELLVAAGGWQPALGLWLTAGGRCVWNPATAALEAAGRLEAVALAGATAGYRGTGACRRSGEAAVEMLSGRAPPAIADPQIEAIYETPDGPTAVAPRVRAARASAWLGRGAGFIARPVPQRRGRPGQLAPSQPVTLEEVAAAVQLRAIPEADAGLVAAERSLGAGEVIDTGWQPPAADPADSEPPPIPAYLAGRFGSRVQTVLLVPADGRRFETGSLVYGSSEPAPPEAALGVVIAPAPRHAAGGIAVLSAATRDSSRLYVGESGGLVPIRSAEALANPRSDVPGRRA